MSARACAALAAAALLALPAPAALADPEADRLAFVKYFQTRFPDVPFDDFANGIYAIDAQARAQWEDIEEFPPYEETIEKGEALYNTPFANGKSYADCFGDGVVRHKYPFFDDKTGEVITLEYDINRCRAANGEKPLKWERGDITALSAHMAFVSRGQRFEIKAQSAAARAAYEEGKRFYYSKRGYLNNSCATCHVQGAGLRVRTEVLHPALGEVTHWPNFRLKWGHIATLHKRIRACHRDQGAAYFSAQSPQYRKVEYYMTYMSNGLPVNGPGVRK
jgi:sulfur-oxidizing protein SoxA